MTNVNIEKYPKTGEFCATLDFGNREVCWNTIHKQLHSGCHCIWVQSDLESYVIVYGKEESCVQVVVNSLKDCAKEGG